MSDDIYQNGHHCEIQKMDKGREEMIYENKDDYKKQTDYDTNRQHPLRSTGSERVRIKKYRSVTVCLVLLCVLLLTAVIVLCVLINTNNQQCHNKTKNITEERDQLLSKSKNLATENERLLTSNTNLNKQIEQLTQQKNAMMEILKADGWIYNQSSLYFISSEKKSWNESRRYCRERGADLIIINNKEEQDLFKKISGTEYIWIGLSDSDEEGRWKWVDGSTMNSSFWRSSEPNGGRKENCAESDSSGWNDFSCNGALKWICEKTIFK